MKQENKERRKTTSCGGLPWRRRGLRIEVLLVKQSPHRDSWGIPKGHMKDGESLEQCAVREIKEEAGVDVLLEQRLPDVSAVYKDEDKTVVSWLAKVVGNDEPNHANLDSEVADARWFGIDQLPTIHFYQRALLATAVKALLA